MTPLSERRIRGFSVAKEMRVVPNLSPLMDASRSDRFRLSPRARQWVAWSLIVEAILWFFSSWWWGGYPRFYGDALAFDWPGQAIYAEHFARGEIPLWDPYSYGGDTWLGIPVRGLFYPGFIPVVLGFWILGAARFSASAYAVYLVAHYVIAAAGVWLLSRRQGWSASWAALAAISYALSLHTITRFTVFNYLIAVVWFPFLTWQLLSFLGKPSWRRAGVWGITLGGVFLGTAPQHDFFLTAGLTLVCWFSWSSWGEERKRVLFRLGAGFLVAVGMAFTPMLYNLEYANFCKRFEMPFEWVDPRAAPWWLMARAFLPCLTGYHYPVEIAVGWGESREVPYTWFHEETIYPGLTIWLGFFLFMSMHGWKDRRTWPWIALFLFGAAWACGEYNPLRIVLRLILWPIATARCPVRGWFIAQLGLSLLAVKGYRDFMREGRPRRPAARAWLGLVAVYGVALGIGWWRYEAVPPRPEEAIQARSLFLMTVGIQGLILLILARRVLSLREREKGARIERLPPVLVLGMLLFAELYVFGSRSIQGAENPEEMYQIPPQLARERERLHRHLQRMDSWEFSLRPAYWRLPTLQGNSNMSLPLSGQGLVGDFRPRGPEMDRRLDLYGVAVAIREGRGGEAFLRQRPNAFPKAWFCTRAIPAPPRQTLQLIDKPSVDLKQTVLLEPGADIPYAFPMESRNDVKVLSYADNEVRLRVSTTTPGWVVINDHFAPGWHCTVNGGPAEILRADRLFRAVHLPAGEHDVRYWFWPDNLTRGFWVGGVALLAGCFMLFGKTAPLHRKT